MTDSQRWFLIIGLAVVAVLVYLLAPILSPFLAGALLAYASDPIADRLEAKGIGRTWSVIIVFVLITLVVMIALLLLLPQLAHQLQVLIERIPVVIQLLKEQVQPWVMDKFSVELPLPNKESLTGLLKEHWQQTGNIAANLVKGLGQSSMALVASLTNMVLTPVVMFYLLRDWDVIMGKLQGLLPRNLETPVISIVKEADGVLGAFVKGQLLVMLGLGIIYATGLWFVGLDLALLIGMLAGLASIVPYMGFIVGIISALIAAYVQFHDATVLIWVAVVFGVGQVMESMVLTPWLVGDRIGLHPVAVIFAVMAGGQLFGFVGVLLALPVAAVIMVLLRYLHGLYKRSRLYDTEPEQTNQQDSQIE